MKLQAKLNYWCFHLDSKIDRRFQKRHTIKAMVALILIAIAISPFSFAFSLKDSGLQKNNVANSFTHTVFCEFGTATWCGPCVKAHTALQNIYESGNYPFYYAALIDDANIEAHKRLYNDYNFYAFPTCFYDGGYRVVLGGYSNEEVYRIPIEESGQRVVPEIGISVSMDWLENAEFQIDVTIYNNETETYTGYLRAYIVEIKSRWKDVQGHPYDFAMLDWAFNKNIQISGEDVYLGATTWDGADHGYGDIIRNNIMVIAAVFNSEKHTGYSDPPENLHAFDAYYVDQTAAATPAIETVPPNTPQITGPTSGIPGTEYKYTFVTTDPDGDDVYYYIEWGDDQIEEWIGPYESDESVTIGNVWEEQDTYTIRVKAKDIFDEESAWETLEVAIPRSKISYNSMFLRILESFPNAYPILRYILGQ